MCQTGKRLARQTKGAVLIKRSGVMSSDDGFSVPTQALARICARYRVKELSLFGSAARGDLRPDSDIDLLVTFEDDARVGLITLARMRRELREAFGRPVDLVPRDGLKPVLKAEVLAQVRTLYAA